MELYEVPGKKARAFESLRFNQLEEFEAKIFDDGRILPEELSAAVQLKNDVKAEFLVIGDIVREMEQRKDPRLGAARAMWRHVNRCLVTIERIESKARAERERTDYGESLKWERLKYRESATAENNIILGFLMGKTNEALQMEYGSLFMDPEARMNARYDAMKSGNENMSSVERSSLYTKALNVINWLNGMSGKEKIETTLKKMAVSHKFRGQRTS